MQTILPTHDPSAAIPSRPGWWITTRCASRGVPRIHAAEIWRVPEAFLEAAQDDATIVAIRDMERAGIDIVTDGEIRRESYSNRFALSLARDRFGEPGGRNKSLWRHGAGAPRDRADHPHGARRTTGHANFLRANTDRLAKITLPGPFTMTQQAKNEYYADDEETAMAYAAAVNEEALDLVAAGADVIQFDEPWMQARPEAAKRYAVRAINRALQGLPASTVVHMCFGYAAMVADKASDGYSFLPQLADTTAGANFDRGGPAQARSRRVAGLGG